MTAPETQPAATQPPEARPPEARPSEARPSEARPSEARPSEARPSEAGGRAGDRHPTSGLDETVHQRHRLGILTITAEAQRAEFGYLREALGLTAGNLSRHLTVLEEAGLVEVDKGYAGRRPRTWVRITGRGRKALAKELSALTELVQRHATGTVR